MENFNSLLLDWTCQFFRRLIGVEPHHHTKVFLHEKFDECLRNSLQNSSSSSNATISLSVYIYEDLLCQLFNQMKFVYAYPILGLMYFERIFTALAHEQLDQMLRGTAEQPELLLRFQSLGSNSATDYPNILLVIHNGQDGKKTVSKNNVSIVELFFQV